MGKVIKMSSSNHVPIHKLIEQKHNLEMLDILINQYIPNHYKFVKSKVKKEQTNNL